MTVLLVQSYTYWWTKNEAHTEMLWLNLDEQNCEKNTTCHMSHRLVHAGHQCLSDTNYCSCSNTRKTGKSYQEQLSCFFQFVSKCNCEPDKKKNKKTLHYHLCKSHFRQEFSLLTVSFSHLQEITILTTLVEKAAAVKHKCLQAETQYVRVEKLLAV